MILNTVLSPLGNKHLFAQSYLLCLMTTKYAATVFSITILAQYGNMVQLPLSISLKEKPSQKFFLHRRMVAEKNNIIKNNSITEEANSDNRVLITTYTEILTQKVVQWNIWSYKKMITKLQKNPI